MGHSQAVTARRSRALHALLGATVTLALLAVLMATLVAVGIAPAASTPGAQDRAGAFLSAAPTCAGEVGPGSPCTRAVSNESTARIAVGCCVAAKGEKGLNWVWKTRPRPGADGRISKIGIERAGDDTISQVHRVKVDGKVVHQHQTHIGKYGGQRQFPDDWVEFPSVGSP